jgi:hypothetical protein
MKHPLAAEVSGGIQVVDLFNFTPDSTPSVRGSALCSIGSRAEEQRVLDLKNQTRGRYDVVRLHEQSLKWYCGVTNTATKGNYKEVIIKCSNG